MIYHNYKKAFTLAEVLITLGIIGVVAAITLPSLIQNYKKAVTVEKLKVAYSIFSQATKMSVSENGPIADWEYENSKELGIKYLVPYLKGIKEATEYSPMRTLSFGSEFENGSAGTRYLTWPAHIEAMKSMGMYILPNGMLVVFSPPTDIRVDYPHILVDINGYKGPNIMGIDGFRFSLNTRTSNLIPTGAEQTGDKDNAEYNSCVRDDAWAYYRGGACAGVIAKNGWKMPDDYPWGNGNLTK